VSEHVELRDASSTRLNGALVASGRFLILVSGPRGHEPNDSRQSFLKASHQLEDGDDKVVRISKKDH
jgi:hypothetical protein